MKKTLLLFLSVITLASCSKDDFKLGYDTPDELECIAYLNNSDFHWNSDDSFILADGGISHFLYTNKSGNMFTSSNGKKPVLGTWFAFYPAADFKECSTGSFEVEIPTEQVSSSAGPSNSYIPMAGFRNNGSIEFYPLLCTVALRIKGDASQTLNLSKAIVKAGRSIAGHASIKRGTKEITFSSDEKSITVDCSSQAIGAGESENIYVMLPEGEYSELSIDILSADGIKTLSYKISKAVSFSTSITNVIETGDEEFLTKEQRLQRILEKQIQDGCSPYVSYVYDVDYAPGQFTNTLPSGMSTKADAIAATETSLVGRTNQYVHLGGWGGSVTVGFDHPILNMEGADFRGYGNAFQGSSEPGVYYVAQKDANGKPEKWYLIKHSMYDYAIHNYEITYYRPVSETQTQYKFFAWKGDYASTTTSVLVTVFNKNGKEIPSSDPDAAKWYLYNDNIYKEGTGSTAKLMKLVKANTVSGLAASEKEIPETYETYPVVYNYTKVVQAFDNYIFWKDNLGHNGYECKNSYHKQSYWPEYAGETITIVGEYLPVNSFDTSGDGSSYVQDAKWWGFPLDSKGFGLGAWGYCDNYANTDPLSTIDIDWAVDENGKKVELTHIDFIKVQSGVHKQSGWIGEISTEFCGVEDLHIKGEKVTPDISTVPNINNIPRSKDAQQPETGLLHWSYKQVPESDIPEYAK